MTAASLFVVVAAGIQLRAGWLVLGSDLVGADDPAHFATGVMVYEYLRHAFSSNPIEFALAFYIRYPKGALGHWPPVYYALQAAWYAVTGPSIEWARVLSAGICCAIAAILFVRLRRLYGAMTGALGAACFLVLPIIQASTWLVMSDLAVALFMLLAVITFAEFLDSGGPRPAAWFAVWSTLAILTKGSGWALGLFALIAPVLARRSCCFRSKWYWISGIAIAVLSAPFYVWARSVQLGYPADVTHLASRAWAVTYRLTLLAPFLRFLPPFVLIIALLGAASSM